MRDLSRLEPGLVYEGYPCSVVAVGKAMGLFNEQHLIEIMPEKLRKDGYLSLAEGNKFIRKYLSVARYNSFKRGDRPSLKQLLANNNKRAIVLCLGHYVYVDEFNTYYSFFDNDNDDVVGIWWLKER